MLIQVHRPQVTSDWTTKKHKRCLKNGNGVLFLGRVDYWVRRQIPASPMRYDCLFCNRRALSRDTGQALIIPAGEKGNRLSREEESGKTRNSFSTKHKQRRNKEYRPRDQGYTQLLRNVQGSLAAPAIIGRPMLEFEGDYIKRKHSMAGGDIPVVPFRTSRSSAVSYGEMIFRERGKAAGNTGGTSMDSAGDLRASSNRALWPI